METLRYLFVTTHFPPYYLGGDAVYVSYLSQELTRRGHEVHVFFNPGAYELVRGEVRAVSGCPSAEEPRLRLVKNPSGRFGVLWALSLDATGRSKSRLRELVGQVRPDVVHWHNTKGFINRPVTFSRAANLYTAHDYFAVCPRSNLQRPDLSFCNEPRMCQFCLLRWRKPPQLWRIGNRRVLRFGSDLMTIAPSDYVAERLRRDGIQIGSILRNFVPDKGISPAVGESERDSVVYVGMIEPHKGPRTLLEAFSVSRERQGFTLHIVGEGSIRRELSERVIKQGLEDRVVVHGFVSSEVLTAILSRAVLQVIPSEWPENAPLTALEAFSMGIPVLGSRTGGLPEILTEDSGSETFRPGDVKDLADCIIRTWDNRDRMNERRRKARDTYERHYSPGKHIEDYDRIVDSVKNK